MRISNRTLHKGSTTIRRQRGFTLVEMMVAVAFLGILGSLVTTTAFQSRKSQVETTTRIKLADQVSRASTWLTRDGHNAYSSDLVDGAPAVNSATFVMTINNLPATCTYSLDGGSLVRSCSGSPAVVATNISGLAFSKAGRLVAVSFNVAVGAESQSVDMAVLEGGW